jgi:hypothetical protein
LNNFRRNAVPRAYKTRVKYFAKLLREFYANADLSGQEKTVAPHLSIAEMRRSAAVGAAKTIRSGCQTPDNA